MATDPVITARGGTLSGSVPLLAALLAADAASVVEGFRPQDVRFFFLLFTNWMGDDHLQPGADLDPTQVRRVLVRLASGGLAVSRSGRPPRWSLDVTGVVRLVDVLTDPGASRRFEETVLLVTVASLYADVIAARCRSGGRAEERRVLARLEPRAILRAECRRLEDALADMRSRRDRGPELGALAQAELEAGRDPILVASRLGRSPYQLHPMRPLPEIIAALPAPLQRFELEKGLALRARMMFGPLAEELAARLVVIERMLANLERD